MNQAAGRRRTQAERTENTRAAIVDATIKAIATDGYQGATTRRIATYAGVSLGAISHQFPNRSALIVAALEEVTGRVTTTIEAATTRHDDTGAAPVATLLDALWRSFSGEAFLVWTKVWLAAAHDPDLSDAVTTADQHLSSELARVIAPYAPPGVSPRAWMRRANVALDAIRGLSLITNYQPHRPGTPERWPATRRELEQLLISDR